MTRPISWRGALPALLVPMLVGCATINSGPYGVPVDAANRPVAAQPPPVLRISAAEVPSLSSSYFGLVEVTFENDSSAWQQIDHIDLDFGSPERNRSVQIPWGDDIATWYDAVEYRNAVDQANTQAVLATLALLGAAGRLAGASGHGGGAAVAAAGGLVAVAAVGAGVAATNQVETQDSGLGARFSAGHLLATPIRVPPGLFTKRWILFYTAARPLGGCIDRVTLGYETADHTRGRVLLRYKADGSPWQLPACHPEVGVQAQARAHHRL